jgi:nitrite reductase (NADH) large subunit
MSEPLVVIGNGMAAARLVEELGRVALGRYSVLVVGAEPHLAYNRILLSSVLAGEMGREETELKPRAWWERQGVTLVYGRKAVAIDRDRREVRLDDGRTLPYARLVLATGSDPIRLPKPGMDLPGVVTFRDHADVDAMLAAAGPGRRAVVIGGGLLGIEAASGLAAAGTKVTLVHLMDRLMERQLDAEAAGLLKAALEARGITVELGADSTPPSSGDGQGHGPAPRRRPGASRRSSWSVAVGIRPNAALARGAGLSTGRGVMVDDRLATSRPDRPRHRRMRRASRHLSTGWSSRRSSRRASSPATSPAEPATYDGTVLATNLKVSGIPLFSAGNFEAGRAPRPIVLARSRARHLPQAGAA